MRQNAKQDNVHSHSATRELELVRYALDKSAIVAVTDHFGNIIHINDKFCEISKYSRGELIGNNHRIINSGHHSKDFFQEMWKTITNGKVWEGEIKNRAKDGSFYWVNTTIVPFIDDNGKPYQYVSIRYEITQRKNAEDQLRVYADRLERSNRELDSSVQAILDREAQILVQDRLASVGLLASSLAHEIGTPLGVIRGRAEYLELQVRDNPQVKKNVDVIISQIDRVSKLIHSLLNLARGDQPKVTGKVFWNTIVEEVLELMAHEFRKHEIDVKNELPKDGAKEPVRAEQGSLHQVVLNLLMNSVHAIEEAIKKGKKKHFIKIYEEDLVEKSALVVVDSGCGISEKNMKNLFKPFFTTKDIGKGTGLGLVTSYRIVQAWGGSIEVKSTENHGAEFRIILPKASLS